MASGYYFESSQTLRRVMLTERPNDDSPEDDPSRRWNEAAIAGTSLDPSTVRNDASRLATGAGVTAAQVEAGFETSSG